MALLTEAVEVVGYESCAGLKLDAQVQLPGGATEMVVLAHGAGAGYDHANMLGISRGLAAHGFASLRFNFPFMQQGKRRVDSREVSTAAIASAVDWAHRTYPNLRLWAGGHSFGGRMASHCELDYELPIEGLVFCSFPLHPAKKPDRLRAKHLPFINKPMLFMTGTRDALADPLLLAEVVGELGDRARLRWLDTADHGYKTLQRTRLHPSDVFDELGEHLAEFVTSHDARG
ncbi:MAG: alpha/beta fold hydrolase [Pseudomonadota bacterium]